jgi:hypothetical protein
LKGRFLAPAATSQSAARSGGLGWPQAARSGLDRREHGASFDQLGLPAQQAGLAIVTRRAETRHGAPGAAPAKGTVDDSGLRHQGTNKRQQGMKAL